MAKIRLLRVDSRLGHGQTIRDILGKYGLNKVIFANDRIFEDEIHKEIEKLTVPCDSEINFLKLSGVKDFLANNDGEYFLILENTSDLEKIIDAGNEIEEINIGIIHMAKGKISLTDMVAVDDEDMRIFKKLYDLGIDTYIRKNIGDPKLAIGEFL